VRRRRETHEEDVSTRVAEGGKGPCPVVLSGEAPRRISRGLLAPGDQARAAPAGDDLALDEVQLP